LGKRVKNNIGITGELERSGCITAIGGLEYKLPGAKKAGITRTSAYTHVRSLIKKGYGANKADVMRKALEFLAEEEAVQEVLKAERELSEGKLFKGDLKKLAKKFS